MAGRKQLRRKRAASPPKVGGVELAFAEAPPLCLPVGVKQPSQVLSTLPAEGKAAPSPLPSGPLSSRGSQASASLIQRRQTFPFEAF